MYSPYEFPAPKSPNSKFGTPQQTLPTHSTLKFPTTPPNSKFPILQHTQPLNFQPLKSQHPQIILLSTFSYSQIVQPPNSPNSNHSTSKFPTPQHTPSTHPTRNFPPAQFVSPHLKTTHSKPTLAPISPAPHPHPTDPTSKLILPHPHPFLHSPYLQLPHLQFIPLIPSNPVSSSQVVLTLLFASTRTRRQRLLDVLGGRPGLVL